MRLSSFLALGFALSFGSNSYATQIEFLNYEDLLKLNDGSFVMANGELVEHRELKMLQSFCGANIGHDLPGTEARPVGPNISYALITKPHNNRGMLKFFTYYSTDKRGNYTATFQCFEYDDLSLDSEQVLQKHFGKSVRLTKSQNTDQFDESLVQVSPLK